MKTLKFLILALGLLAAQGVLAVQLPKTSYSEYYLPSGSEEISIYGSGSKITGNFAALGAGETSEYSKCEGDGNGYAKIGDGNTTCSACCADLIEIKSPADFDRREACVTYCQAGPPLPLDAPLWFMLLLALGGGAKGLLPLLRKIKH